ncbi:hypothetical protein [Pseudoxanthomonas sp. X-1]|uniref:hypothetical protein n=1 Tax=Pseudoxanthomonas sp. X-1 TaxID=2571115 RepID=UPI00110B7B6C|nr:hypothetical protein [Pseudoxanthomonas sp. X-1]TMN18077.1 hypothetical protein FF950_15545 [Pseudoxanthomonas sp. X-1]UAY75400.1 hypothetical protein LAJ50_03840 [Pseudoxanthomonas sp. X-1]
MIYLKPERGFERQTCRSGQAFDGARHARDLASITYFTALHGARLAGWRIDRPGHPWPGVR